MLAKLDNGDYKHTVWKNNLTYCSNWTEMAKLTGCWLELHYIKT